MSLTRSDLEKGRVQEMIVQSNPTVSFLSEAELQASLSNTLQQQEPDSDVWLFAYGSLIWNPVFTFVERRMGMIYGFHRRFCLWVPAGRGTPDHPGLVLGLDRGGSCRGIAFRIAAADISSELLLVWRREMIVGSYVPRWVRVEDGKQGFKAITFVINRQHRRYAGELSQETTVNSIATASGHLGSCADYLMQTVDGLLSVGIKDKYLLSLHNQVQSLRSNSEL
ncbi:MAG: gamma-glutamylcyclotransferase [Cyanobacteriota bacterium]